MGGVEVQVAGSLRSVLNLWSRRVGVVDLLLAIFLCRQIAGMHLVRGIGALGEISYLYISFCYFSIARGIYSNVASSCVPTSSPSPGLYNPFSSHKVLKFLKEASSSGFRCPRCPRGKPYSTCADVTRCAGPAVDKFDMFAV